MGHRAWNYKFQANDILKGKVKDRLVSRVANAAMVEDPSNADNGDDLTEERTFCAF